MKIEFHQDFLSSRDYNVSMLSFNDLSHYQDEKSPGDHYSPIAYFIAKSIPGPHLTAPMIERDN